MPRVLLKPGCRGIQDEDVDGRTPPAWAIQTDCLGVVDALLWTELTDLERRDPGGRTALLWVLRTVTCGLSRSSYGRPQTESGRGETPVSAAELWGQGSRAGTRALREIKTSFNRDILPRIGEELILGNRWKVCWSTCRSRDSLCASRTWARYFGFDAEGTK